MPMIATCHCGHTKIEVPHLPTSATQCNCTFCSRTGALWGYYDEGELNQISQLDDKVYSATGMNLHHFCSNCGLQTWGDSPDWGSVYNIDGTSKTDEPNPMPTKRTYAINLRLIDDLDLSALSIEQVDGRHNW